MFYWIFSYNFCPACGSKTNIAEAGWKRVCTNSSCKTHKGTHNVCYPRYDFNYEFVFLL